MRRNRNNDRGGGRGRQNLPGRPGSLGPGPLLTEHLKDIDLELELLKRKREMIEQQHSIFQPFPKQSQKNYSQQSYQYNDNGGPSGFNCDFSHLYDDGPQHNRKSFGKKRPLDHDWQHDSFPKRSTGHGQHAHAFSGPSPFRNQRPFTSGNELKINLPSKRGHGKSNERAYIPEKKIVQKKIMKPAKAYAPPNKIASQPVAERVNLVTATLKSVAEVENHNREINRLLPDQEPTRQVKGRMEMALGAILFEVREVYANSPHLVTLNTVPVQRIIKQCLRDRIRTTMLGKIVGPTKEIIKEYRDMYPKETDRDIVNEALKSVGLGPEDQPIIAIASSRDQYLEKPDNFFRENMFRLVNSHLYEMFSKIEEIYIKNYNENSNQQIDFTEDSFGLDATSFDTEVNTSNKQEETTKKGEEDNSAKKEEDNNLTKKEKENNSTNEEVKTEENTKNEDNTAKSKEVTIEVEQDITEEKEDTEKEMKRKEKIAAVIAEGEEAAAQLGTLRASQYKFMLPRLIKRYIPTILKLLNMNKMYRQAVCDLNNETRAKYVKYSKETTSQETAQPSATVEDTSVLESTPKKTSQYSLPYYVKIMGKPQLPKKKVMQPFLDLYHPKSIKKHRTIHNLLFIGFTEKNDFEAIVKANGTVIGNTTLSIRVCDTSRDKEEDKANAKNVSVEVSQPQEEKPAEDANSSEKLQSNLEASANVINANSDMFKQENDVIIEPELDNQISELLTALNSDESIKLQEDNNISTENSQKEGQEVDTGLKNEIGDDTKVVTTEAPNKLTEDDDNNENNEIKTTQNVKSEYECDEQHGEKTESPTTNLEPNSEIETKGASKKISTLSNTACKATPTRASTRLANVAATASTIKTRRASKLTQN